MQTLSYAAYVAAVLTPEFTPARAAADAVAQDVTPGDWLRTAYTEAVARAEGPEARARLESAASSHHARLLAEVEQLAALSPLTQREGWAREVEYVHQEGARVWLASGAAGVALDVSQHTGSVRGYVVVDADGLPHGRHTDLDDAAAEAETLGGVSVGDRVEAGEGEDHDAGRVLEVRDGRALVGWEGGACKTWAALDTLRVVERA